MNTQLEQRDLLFGVLGFQMGYIDHTALSSAVAEWVKDRAVPLARILLRRQAVTTDQAQAIDSAVEQQLASSAHNAAHCLTVIDLELDGSIEAMLSSLGEARWWQTLADEAPDPAAPTKAGAVDTAMHVSESFLGDGESDESHARHPAHGPSRYRVVRPHAKGGIGEVFVAWDREVGRLVALKEIRSEFARNSRLRARFLREAEINGNLEHPGIVPVYGLGKHDDGRPYYAMRFVEGGTLQHAIEQFHARANELSPIDWSLRIRPLLARFLDVCKAIAYAHDRNVLHRDLKPANVLLGTYGETLIIDWGLAKLTDRKDTAQADGDPHQPEPVHIASENLAEAPTVAGETLGSPQYMSPEQANGQHDTLTAASDVYSLGATLYCIVTGRAPVFGLGIKETLERVRRGDIPPATSVNARVPKPLEAICSKAMRFEPAERYPTARALADDVDHWLADQPVSVYRDPWWTRLGRWARRHKPQVAAGLALLLTSLVGLAISTLVVNEQKRHVEVAQALAKDHLEIGMNVVDLMVNLADEQVMSQLAPNVRERFLRETVEFNRRFLEREPDNLVIRERSIHLQRRLANLYRITGELERAQSLYGEATNVARELVDRHPTEARLADLLATVLIDLADLDLVLGQTDKAEQEFAQAAEAARRVLERASDNVGVRRTRARSLARLGQTALLRGRLAEAGAPTEEAERLYSSLADPELRDVRRQADQGNVKPLINQLELVETQGQLAEIMEERGLSAEAETLIKTAVGRMEQLQQQFHDAPSLDVHYFHAWIESRLARSQIAQNRLADARATLDRLSARLKGAMDTIERLPYVEVVQAEALMLMSKIDRLTGRTAPAIEHARSALRILDKSEREGERTPDAMLLRAEALLELALSEFGDAPSGAAQARPNLVEANRLVEQVFAKGWNQRFLHALRESIQAHLTTPR